MADQLDEPATNTIRRLLYENWDPSETAGYDPTLDPASNDNGLPMLYGGYVSTRQDPQVTIAQPQGEHIVAGNRWSGKNSDGGMNQYRRGLVFVQTWAKASDTYNGETPQDILHAIRTHVEHILGEFDEGPTDGPNAGLIWSFSTEWAGRFANEVDDQGDPSWQSQVVVTYDWERQT